MPGKSPRRGRPPLQTAEQRRHILSVRVRDETRLLLESAAAKSGRSLSQEVEHRIERTFGEDLQTAVVNVLLKKVASLQASQKMLHKLLKSELSEK